MPSKKQNRVRHCQHKGTWLLLLLSTVLVLLLVFQRPDPIVEAALRSEPGLITNASMVRSETTIHASVKVTTPDSLELNRGAPGPRESASSSSLVVRNIDGGSIVVGIEIEGTRVSAQAEESDSNNRDSARQPSALAPVNARSPLNSTDGADYSRMVEVARTGDDGVIQFAHPEIYSIRVLSPEFRRLGGDSTIAPDVQAEVWVFRWVTIRGRVLFDGPEEVVSDDVFVHGRPAGQSDRGWGQSVESIGSALWLERQFGPRESRFKVRVVDGRYEFEVPAISPFAIVATGSRWTSESKVLDLRPSAGSVIEADLVLRPSSVVTVSVVDEAGQPLKHSRVSVYNLRRVPNGSADVEIQRLRSLALGAGLGVWSSDKSGYTTISFKHSAVTDFEGRALVADATSSVAEDRILLVTRKGYRSVFLSADDFRGDNSPPVVLQRVDINGPYIELVWNGATLLGESAVNIGECIDPAISTSGPGNFTIHDGRLPRTAFENGREYLLTVTSSVSGTRTGRIRIGKENRIEVSALRE